MNTGKPTISRTQLEKEIDCLEMMWDAMIARGDDDYFETTRRQPNTQRKEDAVAKRPRRKRRTR